MTITAIVLASICVLAGIWSTADIWLEHRREIVETRRDERRHVKIVRVPYDWEEHGE